MSTPAQVIVDYAVLPSFTEPRTFGEPMRRNITPTSIIMVIDEISNAEDVSTLPIGVIFVCSREDIPKLNTAHLVMETDRQGHGFVRYIQKDSTSLSRLLGFLVVKRPVPDPDIRSKSLASDPLLIGVLNDLRANVDPESLIPSPTRGCLSNDVYSLYQ